MTNYFKIYLKTKKGSWKKEVAKTVKDVKKILRRASTMNYERYSIVKRLKEKTDVPIASGYFSDFSQECQVVEVDNLDVDYRIVGHNVVIYDKYKESQKGEKTR